MGHDQQYSMSFSVPLAYPEAMERTRDELSKEGFGVLTEIDVRATLKEKIDVEFRPYTILGACNPSLAHKALSAELAIGLLLPCNVVVYATDDPERSVVAAIDPVTQLGMTGLPEVEPLAREVREKLQRALVAVSESST